MEKMKIMERSRDIPKIWWNGLMTNLEILWIMIYDSNVLRTKLLKRMTNENVVRSLSMCIKNDRRCIEGTAVMHL